MGAKGKVTPLFFVSVLAETAQEVGRGTKRRRPGGTKRRTDQGDPSSGRDGRVGHEGQGRGSDGLLREVVGKGWEARGSTQKEWSQDRGNEV